ncbi:MAG TPA: hypothetical protein VMS76_13100 [Planctomycetota bacterium]|nr:hypothetical protein [Planctomycetota bacterium]
MQLLLESELPAGRGERVYREWPWGAVAAEAAALAAGIVLSAIALSTHGALGWLVAAPSLAIAVRLALVLRARSRHSSWVLRQRPDGLVVRISPSGAGLAPTRDHHRVWIPAEEIAGVRAVFAVRELPSLRGESGLVDVRQVSQHLEVQLRPHGPHGSGDSTRELRALLERSQPSPGRISLPSADVVRIPWRVPARRASVPIERALAELGTTLAVLEPRRVPARAWGRLRGRDLDDFVRELVESGDMAGASDVLRLRHGWTSRRARSFVQALLGRAA